MTLSKSIYFKEIGIRTKSRGVDSERSWNTVDNNGNNISECRRRGTHVRVVVRGPRSRMSVCSLMGNGTCQNRKRNQNMGLGDYLVLQRMIWLKDQWKLGKMIWLFCSGFGISYKNMGRGNHESPLTEHAVSSRDILTHFFNLWELGRMYRRELYRIKVS